MGLEFSQVQKALGKDYTVEEIVGRGGMAVVFRARDHRHDRLVAVKVLKEEFAGSAHAERFLREMKLEGQLQHPHITPIFDSGSGHGLLYYIMPLVEGETLRSKLDRDGMLPTKEAIRIGREVAEALAHAHHQGVIHRDVKPSNILLRDNHALVSDFGVARALERSAENSLTETGVVVGTPAYMSPEQAGGHPELDGRSDIYSLGCVLHEMLGGEPPFSGPNTQSVLAKHLNERPPSLTVIRPDLPVWLSNVVRRTLAKVPADRFQSADELAETLATQKDPGPVDSGAWPDTSRPRWFKRPLWTVGLVLTGLVLLWYGAKPAMEGWLNPTPLQEGLIVCFPLSSRGGEDFQGEDVALTISRSLETTGVLSCLDGWHYLTEGQRRDIVSLTAEEAQEIARGQRAANFILGSVSLDTDSVSVTLALHDTRTGAVLEQQSHIDHRTRASAAQVGVRAFMGFLGTLLDPGRPPPNLQFLAERDQSAVATWIRGERLYRSLQFDSAYALLREAVALDSLLIPAALKGAQAASWAHHGIQSDTLVSLALRHDSLLTPEQAHLAHGLAAHFVGAADSAVAHYRRALELDRTWAEAWTALGETYYHLLPSDVEGYHSAEEAFRESLALDPEFMPPLIHLIEIAVWEEDHAEARRLLDELEASPGDSGRSLRLELLTSCARDSEPHIPWEEAAALDPSATLITARYLSMGARYPRCAEDGFRAVLAHARDRPRAAYTWGALMGLGGLLVATDRGEEAGRIWQEAEQTGEAGAVPFLYLLGATVSPALNPHAARIDTLGRRLFGADFEELRPIEGWSLGIWYASQGYQEDLELLAQQMEILADRASATSITPMLNFAIQGHLAASKGDTTEAIERFYSVLDVPRPGSDLTWGIREVLPYERLRLSELLLARNRLPEAWAVASVFDHPAAMTFLYFLPQSLAVRIKIATAMGWDQQVGELERRLDGLGRGELR